MLASVRDANASGAARRRQRRLRQWLRHKRLSVAMAPRGPKTARAGEEDHEMHYTATVRTHPPPQVAGTEFYELSDEDVVPARGSRPPCLGEPRGPQERDLPRTVEQIAVPMVQILDALVTQMVEQLPDVMRFFDFLLPVPEQVIEVPKILLDDVPMRTVVRDTQLVEQLVEVPTIVSWSMLQQIMEQNVDIPVVDRGSGAGGGLSGFLPGQYSMTGEQIVDNPVPGGGEGISGLQGFFPGQSSTAPTVAQIVDILGGSLQGSHPGQGSPVSSSFHSPAGSDDDADEPGKGVFRTFPQNKKSAKVTSGSELPPHPSSSTAAAQLEWVRLNERHVGKTYFWNRRTNGTVWLAPDGVEVVWYGEKDQEGRVWYWHRDTRISTFDLPPLPPG